VNAGGIVDLSVTGNRAFTVTSWQPGTLFPDQTAITQNIILTTPVTITVSGKTTDGCYDTTTVSLTLGSDDNVWIPNAFTPDNSGYNDFFYVHGSSIVLLELSVWNKYGQMIFNTKSRNAGWDGTYKGKPQPQGTYVFTATIILSNGTELKRKGTVILLR
jgi:gliding motility-associated-like protein